jgi:hypothetical protein
VLKLRQWNKVKSGGKTARYQMIGKKGNVLLGLLVISKTTGRPIDPPYVVGSKISIIHRYLHDHGILDIRAKKRSSGLSR